MTTAELILNSHNHTNYSVKKNGEYEPVIFVSEALPAMEEYAKDIAVAFADWHCNGVSNRDRKLPDEMYADFLAIYGQTILSEKIAMEGEFRP
jgi:hypothetical protein